MPNLPRKASSTKLKGKEGEIAQPEVMESSEGRKHPPLSSQVQRGRGDGREYRRGLGTITSAGWCGSEQWQSVEDIGPPTGMPSPRYHNFTSSHGCDGAPRGPT